MEVITYEMVGKTFEALGYSPNWQLAVLALITLFALGLGIYLGTQSERNDARKEKEHRMLEELHEQLAQNKKKGGN